MATEFKTGALCVLMMGACGCVAPKGCLVTYTTAPYTLPYEAVAHVGSKSCEVDITQIKEPITQARLSVMWSNRAVADAMERAGMAEIRYADLQTLSIFNSAYERRRLIFYGE
jgi:hypothetical protein